MFTLVSAIVFLGASWALGPLCLALSPVALAVVLGYSLTKRFTVLCHLVLGIALGIAPLAAWIAIAGSISATPLLLSAVVVTWVAGFDVIYACQDVDFDRREGLHSAPGRFGIARALGIARAVHVLTIALLALLAWLLPLGIPWLAGTAGAAALLLYEHRLVRPHDLGRVDQAFFTVNGCLSFLVLAATALDRLLAL
jgi:4-hydroxybenzoate polyprenyltransferase